MSVLIHNDDNLKIEDINNVVRRAKLLIINSNDDFLLAKMNNDVHIVGGHVEDGETDAETIIRETKEEAGIDITYDAKEPFMCIEYLCKDYPNKNQNTRYISNYYILKDDIVPDLNNIKLEKGEIEGNFELLYVNKNNILNYLDDSIKEAHNKNVVNDTIEVIKKYLKED